MKYSSLIDNATETEMKTFLVGGDQTAVTIRIPENLKNSAQEAAQLKGMSFSAFVRMALIEQLVEEGR